MEVNGSVGKSMEVDRSWWKEVEAGIEVYGSRCKLMEMFGSLWKRLEVNGSFKKSMEVDES